MIPLWIFILACIAFVTMMYREYRANKELEGSLLQTGLVLNKYMEKFGKEYGNQVIDEFIKEMEEEE